MGNPLKLFSEVVRKAPEILRGKNPKPLEAWMNQLKGKFSMPAIQRALSIPPGISVPGSPGYTPPSGPLSKQQVVERLKPLQLEFKDLARTPAHDDLFQRNLTRAHENAVHLLHTYPLYQRQYLNQVVDAIADEFPEFAQEYRRQPPGPDTLQNMVRVMMGEGFAMFPERFARTIPQERSRDWYDLADQVGSEFRSDLANDILRDPEAHNLDPGAFSKHVGAKYRWKNQQRLLPEDHPGYFEHGLIAPGSGLKSEHFSDVPDIMGHLRGTYKEPSASFGKDGSLPLLQGSDFAVPRTYLEEIQSDTGKTSNSPLLHNVHGALAKMGLLGAMEKGPGSQLWVPNAGAIAIPRGGPKERYAPVYDQELQRQLYGPLKRRYGLNPERVPMEDAVLPGTIPNRNPAWNVLSPNEDVRNDILEKGIPHLKKGGRVGPLSVVGRLK